MEQQMNNKNKKRTLWKSILMQVLKAIHLLAVPTLFMFCWYFFYAVKNSETIVSRYDIVIIIVYFLDWFFMAKIYNIYALNFSKKTDLIFGHVLSEFVIAVVVYVLHTIMRWQFRNPLFLLAVFGEQAIFSVLWILFAHWLYFKIHKPKRTIAIYKRDSDLRKLQEISKFPRKFDIEKFVKIEDESLAGILPIIEGYEIIFVAGVEASTRNGIIKYCVDNKVQGYFAPHVGDVIFMGGMPIQQFSTPVIGIRRVAPAPYYLFLKRFFDIFVSLIAIILLSPLMLVTAIIIKCYDRGPVIYSHIRLTTDRKPFKIYKFRSMRVDAEKDGVARLSTEHDDRITPVGKFIRKCRLDELPQLFNILKGDMTIVGPRPERPEIAEQYEKEIPAFALRLQVKAGLTGYAQVYGRYNTNPYDKMQMDLMYINNMGIFEDLRLMFATVRILFAKESTSGIDDNATTANDCDKTNM